MKFGLRHLTGTVYALAFIVFLLFGFISCSDAKSAAVTASQVCNIEPPFSKNRTILQVDTVEHEYDNCASELVYYIPIPGDTAYPPCGDHGGNYITDFGSEYWGCIDGTVRNFSQGTGREYSSGPTGLETGESYGTYFRIIASSETTVEDTATVTAVWTPSELNADPSLFTLSYNWRSAGLTGNTDSTMVTFSIIKTNEEQSFIFCVTPIRLPDNVTGPESCKSYIVPPAGTFPTDTLLYVPHVTAYHPDWNQDSVISRYAQAPVGDGSTLTVDSGEVSLLAWIRLERRDGDWEQEHGPLPNDTTEAEGVNIAGVDSVKFWLDGNYANREQQWPYEMFLAGIHEPIPLTIGEHDIRYQVFGISPEERTVTIVIADSIIPDVDPPLRPISGIDRSHIDQPHTVEVTITLRDPVPGADTVIWRVRDGGTGATIEERRLPADIMTQMFIVPKRSESYPLRFRWWGKNAGGEGEFADDAAGTIPADTTSTSQILPPENVNAVISDDNSIIISFDDPNITNTVHRFYYQLIADNVWNNTATLIQNQYQFKNLILNNEYNVGVSTYDGDLESAIVYASVLLTSQ